MEKNLRHDSSRGTVFTAMKIRVSAQLNSDDCVAARWVALRPRRSLQVLGCCILVLLAAVLAWQIIEFTQGTPFQSGFWWLLGAMAYLGLILALIPLRVRRVFRQQKTLHPPFEMEFSESHFSGSSTHGSFSIPWSDFHKWKAGNKSLLIYQSEAIMHLIPCRAFASEADREAVLRLLETTMGKQKP